MTDLRKAAEMALEALTLMNQDIEKHRATLPVGRQSELCKASLALRQALAQPVDAVNISQERVDETAKGEHEPVAWITDGGKGELWWYQSSKYDEEGTLIGPNPDDVPLYTAPPKKEWVGLTEEEVFEFADTNLYEGGKNYGILSFGKAIEAKLKEKNCG